MWTLEQIVTSSKMLEVANLDHEVSVALYVKPGSIAGLNYYDKVGNAAGVELPNVDDIEKGCVTNRTKMIILVHNHPYLYGDCDATPSDKDLEATDFYKNLLQSKGITLLDHIIVCPKGYFSFKQNNLL
jgi:hypothetical protein